VFQFAVHTFVSFFFCVKEVTQKIAYSRWSELINFRIKCTYQSFGNNLSFVSEISAKILYRYIKQKIIQRRVGKPVSL